MKDDGMAKVVEALLSRLRRAEAEIVLLKRENERYCIPVAQKKRELSRKRAR